MGQNEGSFESASKMTEKAMDIKINKSTVREITEYIGEKIYKEDEEKAKTTYENIEELEMQKKKDNILYIMMDGAAVNTRIEDENGPTRRENKLVTAFRSNDVIKRKNEDLIIVKKSMCPIWEVQKNSKNMYWN